MNFSDGELALAIGAGRAMRNTTAHAQALVDRKNSEIAMLTAELQKARAELRTERAKRLIAEDRLERLLDMPA